MIYKKPDYYRFHSFHCWRGFRLLRFPEELLDSLHYEGPHEFLDSHGDSRRAYGVSAHHNCTNWFYQENLNFLPKPYLSFHQKHAEAFKQLRMLICLPILTEEDLNEPYNT